MSGVQKGSRDHDVVDTGLQPERTSLAWTRTSLAFVLLNCIAIKEHGQAAVPVVLHMAFVVLFVFVSECLRLNGLHAARDSLKLNGYHFAIGRGMWLLVGFWAFVVYFALRIGSEF